MSHLEDSRVEVAQRFWGCRARSKLSAGSFIFPIPLLLGTSKPLPFVCKTSPRPDLWPPVCLSNSFPRMVSLTAPPYPHPEPPPWTQLHLSAALLWGGPVSLLTAQRERSPLSRTPQHTRPSQGVSPGQGAGFCLALNPRGSCPTRSGMISELPAVPSRRAAGVTSQVLLP